ncbi:hypothetical protein N7E81_17810 [Reichenbachiella carrageenanivorans]|uniref:Response regulatory domain-containing protein n=1 Tax=Reichenbachiella carrageenanivorans TaxID=2979869 RepID=A0ABY6CZ71_9BACT|nr:hypothetical protein [Reichenbachiella carrageenanivorans]UXX79212.1 hypothetical protein N7E81_17810 [Reichenbachiella carrageenanivorans]
MEQEILIGSNSDLIVQQLTQELLKLSDMVHIKVVDDFLDIQTLKEGQLVIIDLSVYTSGILDRVEQFKQKFQHIELIAVTYENDTFIDQVLIRRGVDQVTSRDELLNLVSIHLSPNWQTTG